MQEYIQTVINGYKGYASYLWHEITHPGVHNYFYALIAISLFFFIIEVSKPWRKEQKILRKDFWLDLFYMFFNFFLFSLIVYNAASDLIVNLFNDTIISLSGVDLQAINPLRTLPMWAILLIGFLVRDFVQWWTHRLLHRIEFLWQFHKVHHSVEEMGFAAHLRYHWMETIVYRTIEYVPLALLGIGLYDFFIIHIFTLAIGHYNHSNVSISGRVTGGILGLLIGIVIATQSFDISIAWMDGILVQTISVLVMTLVGALLIGPFMKRIFNHPEMHIWHHAMEIPSDRKFGVNFGLSLAVWDYLFDTAYIPYDGRDIKLGFTGIEEFPSTFGEQIIYGIKR